jgi:cobalt-zinc-cadmium efflux system membrane fusion protein
MTLHRARAIAGALTIAAAASAACGPRSDAAAAPPDETTAAASRPRTVTLDSKMAAAIVVGVTGDQASPSELTIAGRVQFDEDRLAHVLAPVAGQIVDLRVKVGDRVTKGERLCTIASRDAAAAVGEFLESQKDLELAEKTAAMTADLYQHEAASRMTLQQAQSDLAKAQSRVARTSEALRVLGLAPGADLSSFNGRVPIVAPIGGTVIDRKVTEGQFEQADSAPIFTVADASVVWVVGDVFERDLHLVSLRQAAKMTTAAYPGESFAGHVDYISDSIDPATRSAKLRVSVPNPAGRLKPEMFASIDLDIGPVDGTAHALTIPASAIFVEEGRTYVYAEVGPRTFERRAIEVSPQDQAAGATAVAGAARRRVVDGLKAGDRIVVDGAILVRQQEDRKAG